jgi:hypothetical protein
MLYAAQLSLVRRVVAPMLIALSCAFAVSAQAQDDGQAARMVHDLHRNLARSFVLDKKLPLDAELRAAAGEISAQHLARMDQLLPVWVAEARQQLTGEDKTRKYSLYFAVWARVLNELALWQIEPGDADYERATLEVLKSSAQVCPKEGDSRFSDFSSRILRIQAMPVAQRAAALATERQLLAQWGQARGTVPPWPDPLPQDAAMALIKRGRDDVQRLALPPVVASELLGEQKDYAAMGRATQCRLQKWWLQESLREGATPASALNAFRYGTLISASFRLAGMFSPDPDDKADAARGPVYPPLANHFAVTGTTTVSAQLNADGTARQATIALRKVEVPGIQGVRALAFEDIFDQNALNYALRNHYPKPKTDKPFQFEMVWSLDGSTGTPANTPKGGKP